MPKKQAVNGEKITLTIPYHMAVILYSMLENAPLFEQALIEHTNWDRKFTRKEKDMMLELYDKLGFELTVHSGGIRFE